MKLRNKIILVQGQRRIADLITLTEFSRINTDRIVLIAALRYPQLLPANIDPMNLNGLLENLYDILDHFAHTDHIFLVLSEYANVVMDRGTEIKVVEGQSMNVSWIYKIVKTLHKNLGQAVTEVKTESETIFIDQVSHPWDEGLLLLRQTDSPG